MKIKILCYSLLIIMLFYSNTLTYANKNRQVLHPKFSLFDKEGNLIKKGNANLSVNNTCGKCHNINFINRNNLHYNKRIKVSCVVCHLKNEKTLEAGLDSQKYIQSPSNMNCSYCHGIVHNNKAALSIPKNYTKFSNTNVGKTKHGITKYEGAVFSDENISDSLINIKDKDKKSFSWDVHARRQLKCTSCHYTKNKPSDKRINNASIIHLKNDPRKNLQTHEYIKAPDHNFISAKCIDCHDPFKVHKELPFKKRHFQKLSCTACHIKKIYGPALRLVDMTLINKKGEPRIEIRGEDSQKNHGDSINTKHYNGYEPFLFPTKNSDGTQKIVPVNFITYWFWIDNITKKPVDISLLRNVILENTNYTSEFITVFDENKNTKIENSELLLNTEKKIIFIKKNLKNLGVTDPEIFGEVKTYQIKHGVADSKTLKKDCVDCHSSTSRLNNTILISEKSPLRSIPELSAENKLNLNGRIEYFKEGLFLKRGDELKDFYIFGNSRIKIIDSTGFMIFVLSIFLIILHGGIRLFTSRKYKASHEKLIEVYMYGFYERLWHWIMASSMIGLLITGFEIHYSGRVPILGLNNSILIHNILSSILIINAVLSFLYHIFSGEIKQFFKIKKNFIKESALQAFYYIFDIFKREPHPIEKSIKRKFNPIQQLAYIFVLSFLLPFQFISGIMIWFIERFPDLSIKIGGLTYIAPLHNLGAWLLLSFLITHLYLITTGHRVLSNIKAMITGYDMVPENSEKKPNFLLDKNLFDLIGTLLGKITK